MISDDHRGVFQSLGSLVLAFGADNLGTSLTLGFSLFGHGSAHLIGQINALHFYGRYLDAPWIRVFIQNFLKLEVDLITLVEDIVKLHLAANRTKGRLGKLGSSI